MSRLFLVRHGKTEGGEGLYFGHSDVALSQEGIQQADKLKSRLASEKLTAIYSSDLARSRKTAEVIASAHHNLSVTLYPVLRELNFGIMEGKSYEEIHSLYPEISGEWFSSEDFALPGGESLKDLEKRLKLFLDLFIKASADENVLIVSHKGALRVLICMLIGLNPRDYWKLSIEPASLSVADKYPQGTVLQLLNDTAHLREEER